MTDLLAQVTFSLFMVFTSPDGGQSYSIIDESLHVLDCMAYVNRLQMAPGYHLECVQE